MTSEQSIEWLKAAFSDIIGLVLTGILTNLIMRFTNKLKDDILMHVSNE